MEVEPIIENISFDLVDFVSSEAFLAIPQMSPCESNGSNGTLSDQELAAILADNSCSALDASPGYSSVDDDSWSIGNQLSGPEHSISTESSCPICNKPVGKHSYYGARVCVSCRGFFRRSVQNHHYPLFKCNFNQNCSIDSKSRTSCKACRYQKCLAAGMKPALVMSNEQRKKRILMKYSRSSTCPDLKKSSEMTLVFTDEDEKQCITEFHEFLKGCYTHYINFFADHLELLDALANSVYTGRVRDRRVLDCMDHLDESWMTNYCFQLPQISSVSAFDKMTLLRHNYPIIFGLLWGAYNTTHDFFTYFFQVLEYAEEVQSCNEKAKKILAFQCKERFLMDPLAKFPTQECIYEPDSSQRDDFLLQMKKMNDLLQCPGTNKLDLTLVYLVVRYLMVCTDFQAKLENRDNINKIRDFQLFQLKRYVQSKHKVDITNIYAIQSTAKRVHKAMQRTIFS